MALRVGYEKLQSETGWKPNVSWEEGIRRTIAWFAEHQDELDRPGRLAAVGTRRRRPTPPVTPPPVTRRAPDAPVRALVTGGAGFLGSFLVEQLRARGDEVIVPRRAEFDLTRWDDAERLFAETRAGARLPPCRRGRRDRREPVEPRPLLVREPHDGHERARAVTPPRRLQAPDRGHRLRLSQVHARRPSTRTTSGTATPKRRTRPTASRRSRSSSAARPTASSTGSTRSTCCPANLYGPRDNFDLETSHVVPALVRKMLAGTRRGRSCGATARRRASSSTSRTQPAPSCSQPTATRAPSRSTSGRASRSRSASSPRRSPS